MTSSMDEELQLQMKLALLEQEVELLKAKLQYVRLFKSEQQRGSSSSSEKKNEEHVSASSTEPQRIITESSSNKGKSVAIPEQTATGKESTNPLTVNSLPKAVSEVQTSKTLVTPLDFVLKPNGGIQIPKKTEDHSSASTKVDQGIQIPNTNHKTYYVVYNGPNAGIYEDWSIAKKATDGVSNIAHKKFKTFLEAKTSADLFTRSKMIEPLQLICSADTLRPNNFAQALASKKRKQVSLGRLPTRIEKESKEEDYTSLPEINQADFEMLYRNARLADEQLFVDEHYFTTDNKNLSFYNFVQNANPEQVFEAFQYGLVKQIYPSSNLQEISYFPKQLISSIKTFRKKCINKPNTDIFLKINSSVPAWNEEGDLVYTPHHLIQIGICKDLNYHPSKPMECKIMEEDLKNLAIKRLEDLCNKIFNSFFEDSKIFVNHFADQILLYSNSGKKISGNDEVTLLRFQRSITRPFLLGTHIDYLCKIFKGHCSTYSCDKCDAHQVAPATTNNGAPIIKEDAAGPSMKTPSA